MGCIALLAHTFIVKKQKTIFFEKGFGYQEILTLKGEVPPQELFAVLFNRHQNVNW